jgi:hypothetical protein
MAEKQRSPNYPGFGLPEAILKAKQLYEHDGRSAVPRDVAVQAWGYQGTNGASLRVLGALRQFGLLEVPTPGTVRVSSDALVLILEPTGSVEYRGALSSVAMRPAIFRVLAQQYPDGLPSEAAIVSFLVRTENFSAEAARVVIGSYRDTLALTAGNSIENADAEAVNVAEAAPVPGRRSVADEPKQLSLPSLSTSSNAPYDLTLALIGGEQATLRIPRRMSLDNYNLLTTLIDANLRAMKRALVIESDDAELSALL